jgi:hypothetical protein
MAEQIGNNPENTARSISFQPVKEAVQSPGPEPQNPGKPVNGFAPDTMALSVNPGEIKSNLFSFDDKPGTSETINYNDDILFIGLNSEAKTEADALRKNIVKSASLYLVEQAETGKDTFKDADGTVFNLNDQADLKKFVESLGLSQEKSAEITGFINTPVKNSVFGDQGTNIRDELAQIIKIWSVSEKGGSVPSRLVLSGHSVGDGITGESNGTLSISLIQTLAGIFPRAAAQIEDLHISGCSSGGEIAVATYREIFPNLKTGWTYSHSSPSTGKGATVHQQIWEKETRGRNDSLDRGAAKGTRLAENVNTWSLKTGFKDGRPLKNINDLLSSLDEQTPLFARFYMGQDIVRDNHNSPLRSYYELVQDILQSKPFVNLPPDKKQSVEVMRDKTIRLLFYTKSIAPDFARNFSEEIKKGYAAIGSEPPDFAKLSRAGAIMAIADFDNNVGQNDDAPEAAKALLHLLKAGLKDLSRDIIPDGWLG